MVGNWFLRIGALFGLASIGLVIYIAYQHDPKLSPVQVQVATAGWIGMFLAGLFYSSISTTSEYVETIGSQMPRWAGFHFFIAFLGAVVLVAGTVGVAFDLTFTGKIGAEIFDAYAWGEKVTLAGSALTGVAQLVFLFNVLRGTSR